MGQGEGKNKDGDESAGVGKRAGKPASRDPGSRDPGKRPRKASRKSPSRKSPSGKSPAVRHERAFVRALPMLLIVVGIFYDLSTPPQFTAAPLFAAAPLIAAPFYSLLTTSLIGLGASVAVLGLHFKTDTGTNVDAVTEVFTVVTVAVLAVLINRVVRRGDEQLASARSIAEAAQRAVLPQPDPRIGGLDVAARYEAAQADAFIGGDLYAVQDTPHGVRVIVGDVRGKGMGAVAAVAVVIGAFREAAEQEATLEAVAQRLERALAREGTRRDGLDDFEGFTTAILAEIPHSGGLVRLINRGHPGPLLLHGDGRLWVLSATEPALPLGMGELGVWPDRADETEFPPGAMLLLHTDGLSEARDSRGEFYDPAARLGGRIFPGPDGPDALLATLTEEVRRHTGGGTTDDMALLAVRRPLSSGTDVTGRD